MEQPQEGKVRRKTPEVRLVDATTPVEEFSPGEGVKVLTASAPRPQGKDPHVP